jgi:lipopolysaccharide export system protein LptA
MKFYNLNKNVMKARIFTLLTVFALVSASFVYSQTARVQIIHNSADDLADSVDVYLNGTKLLNNFAFRNATPFIDAPADAAVDIGVAPMNSTSVDDTIYNANVTFNSGETYIVVANGIVSGTGYTPAPEFDFYIFSAGQEESGSSGETDVLVFHGSTDAPTVDITETHIPAKLENDLSYASFSDDYIGLETDDYSLQVQDSTGRVAVAQYGAPLETLGLEDSALVVLASGFLDTTKNSGGPAFGLYAALPSGGKLVELPSEDFSTGEVQVIHNSADLAADSVDVYFNDEKLMDNFAFRNATSFEELPAGILFDISVQPKASTDTAGALYKETVMIGADKKYVVVANGIVSPTGYEPAKEFGFYVYEMGQKLATEAGKTDVLVFHGSTDAPVVDVKEPGFLLGLVENLAYGEFTENYIALSTNDYSLQVQDSSGRQAVAQFGAPLESLGLEDSAMVVLASGFLDTANNSNGAPFGLYAALPSGGELVELPGEDISSANVQVIHNSADLAADTVDVWLNDQPLLDNFAFRNASPFVELTAGTKFDISIQPKTSSDTTDALFKKSFSLEVDSTYILVANGIVSSSGYTPSKPFDIYAYGMGQTEASMTGETDVLVFHGSTDAPTVDVEEPNAQLKLIDDMSYGEFYNGYLNLSTSDYALQIQNEYGSEAVAQYGAPLGTLGLEDSALVVLASGFLAPSNNSDGPDFGLYAALPSGGELVELPGEEISKAMVQVIHNSADANAAAVDIYLNDQILLDDFGFRKASPFVPVTAGTDIDISVQPSGSSDTTNALAKFNYQLMPEEKYVLTASGLVSTSGYDPVKPFDIKMFSGARTQASQSGNTDLLVYHGATDAPTVDLYESSGPAGTLVDNLMYGAYSSDYLELSTDNYILDIQDETGSNTVARYEAYLSDLGLADSALVAVASGFLDPSVNSDGEPFGLFVALPSGGDLIALSEYEEETSLGNSLAEVAAMDVYPNPVSDELIIDINNQSEQSLKVEIYNLMGQKVLTDFDQQVIKGQRIIRYNLSSLSEGVYFVVLTNGEKRITEKIKIVK